MSKKYTLLAFKGICMNFLLEFKFFILSHPVTSKQPQKIVQILLGHPVSALHHNPKSIPRIDIRSEMCVNLMA